MLNNGKICKNELQSNGSFFDVFMRVKMIHLDLQCGLASGTRVISPRINVEKVTHLAETLFTDRLAFARPFSHGVFNL